MTSGSTRLRTAFFGGLVCCEDSECPCSKLRVDGILLSKEVEAENMWPEGRKRGKIGHLSLRIGIYLKGSKRRDMILPEDFSGESTGFNS